MVSASERVAFVLQNFLLIYQNQGDKFWTIDYAQTNDNGLLIPDLSAHYFDSGTHFKEIHIEWVAYQDEKIPLLFANQSLKEAYIINEKIVVFQFDIISALFFFLSGWQETATISDDKFGRFTYSKSIQKQLNISNLPVVNYYFLLLKEALEKAFKIQFINKINSEGKFNIIVTHDIDYWQSLWWKELKYAVKIFSISKVIQLSIKGLEKNYYKNTFNKIEYFQNKYGFKSTFFFLPDTKKYLGNENADYNIQHRKYSSFIKSLSLENEIGLHGSFTSSFDEQKLASDLNSFDADLGVNISRFHFLMFNIETTSTLLNKFNIKIDSTLGFNDMPGFRFSTSYPFYLFDYEQNKTANVIEFPLILMDATIFYHHYLACKSKAEAWQIIEPILIQLQKTGGNMIINWHNDAFASLGREIWVETFEAILEYCQNHQIHFKNFGSLKTA